MQESWQKLQNAPHHQVGNFQQDKMSTQQSRYDKLYRSIWEIRCSNNQ